MLGLSGPLGTIIDLLTVVVGFGLIVFFHELGHFLAARWAGIRVLTFAIGFGPPLLSWRRGVGLRRGSSFAVYQQAVQQRRAKMVHEKGRSRYEGISPTEYRLSALPFGGYVQMLGQDDLDPAAVSNAPDSYQRAPIWKRMVVISAGVAMNLLLAGVLFVVVFMAGLTVEPPVVGAVRPGSPAAVAVAGNAAALGVVEPGIAPGDEIVEIDGHAPRRFDSVALKVAMAEAGRPLAVRVRREGLADPLEFRITPEKGDFSGLLELGIAPAISTAIVSPRDGATRAIVAEELARLGLAGLEPGDRISAVNGVEVAGFREIDSAFAGSAGAPVTLTVQRGDRTLEIAARARAQMEMSEVIGERTGPMPLEHLLGLVPVMRVADRGDINQGLAHGDVFARIGSVEFPSFPAGINEIQSHAGGPVMLEVLRSEGEETRRVTLEAKVSKEGRVGFTPDDTLRTGTLLAMPPAALPAWDGAAPESPPAAGLITRAGARLVSVNGSAVGTLDEVRAALLDATRGAREAGAESVSVEIVYDTPFATNNERVTAGWTLDRAALDRLGSLGWEAPLPGAFFEPLQVVMKAAGPFDAVAMGVAETHRVMMSVYVTFLRLTQGSLQVQHIKGPVGIAHLGTLIADRGLIWLLFFLGMISVNLAVVNFLPLPIVDGGQFLMLLYEQIRGKPVPIPVQNAVMTAGLLLIVSVFLVVTFNDIRALLGG